VTLNFPNSAILEIQPGNGCGEQRKIVAMFHSFAGRMLRLNIDERLTASTAVGVEYNDILFIGEVLTCTPTTGDQWTADVKVAHTLTGLQSLMRLRAQLEQCQAPANPVCARP
jgi:hypothetical protein